MEHSSNHKLNVLLFIDWFLPGTNSGGPVRSYANMIDYMKNDLKFFVITRDTDYCANIPYENIEYNKWNELSNNLCVWYLKDKEINMSTFRRIEKSVPINKIYINGIYSYKFSILPLITFWKRKKDIVVSARGMLNPQAFSVKGFRKKMFLLFTRVIKLYKDLIIHATNEKEKKHIRILLGKHIKIVIAPNFPRKLDANRNRCKIDKKVGHLNLVNVARIAKEKGTLKMLEVLGELPNGIINLDIYGPIYDTKYWSECQDKMKKLGKNISVTYKGNIESYKVPSVMSKYEFFIMLSEGENFGHSILEALSMGLPVIISDQTPWKNLEHKGVGWDICLSDTNRFVTAIQKVIAMDNIDYKDWSESAFNYATEIINDPKTYKQNKALFVNR